MAKKRPEPKSAFGESIKAVQDLKTAMASGENISLIPLSLIYSPKTHDRKCFTDNEIKELAQSIRKSGLLQPIVVRKIGDKFERLIGFKRILATKLNGEEYIKAIVLENVNDKEAALITISENLFRSDPNAYDQISAFLEYASIVLEMENEQIKKLLHKHKTSAELDEVEQDKLALLTELLEDGLQISIRTFIDKLRVLSLNPLLIEAIQKREIPYSIALVLGTIKSDDALRDMLKNIVANNLSVGEVKKLVDNKPIVESSNKLGSILLAPKYKKSISKLPEDKQSEVNAYLLKIENILKSEA
ncbi:MAG: ParB/RepB/Spo0J family partition protein [Sulfurimonas sp.]|jgi:ParB family chromosome partitioning protein